MNATTTTRNEKACGAIRMSLLPCLMAGLGLAASEASAGLFSGSAFTLASLSGARMPPLCCDGAAKHRLTW